MEIHRFPARRRDYAGRAITGPLTPVVNRFVRERLRLIPHEQRREQLLTLTGLIVAGKLTPVSSTGRTRWPARPRFCRVEQGHARGKVVITVA